jgi:hypothetical protein
MADLATTQIVPQAQLVVNQMIIMADLECLQWGITQEHRE